MVKSWHMTFKAHLAADIREESVDDEGGIGDLAECIMGSLVEMDSCDDPDVDLDLVEGLLTIAIEVQAADWSEASTKVLSTVRAAFSACDAATPGWEHVSWAADAQQQHTVAV